LSLVDASSTQAMAVVMVGAIAGSCRCRHLVNNAGGWRTTVGMGMGMGMGVIASSPSMLGMVTGVVIVVGGHVNDTGDVGGRIVAGDHHRRRTMLGMMAGGAGGEMVVVASSWSWLVPSLGAVVVTLVMATVVADGGGCVNDACGGGWCHCCH